MQSLVDLAEERPEAVQLMRGRTFARAVHWRCMMVRRPARIAGAVAVPTAPCIGTLVAARCAFHQTVE